MLKANRIATCVFLILKIQNETHRHQVSHQRRNTARTEAWPRGYVEREEGNRTAVHEDKCGWDKKTLDCLTKTCGSRKNSSRPVEVGGATCT